MSEVAYVPALIRSLRAGYTRKDLIADLLAGLLVGVVALPLSMGLAIASGATAEQGLYIAIVGGLLISIFGGTRVQIGGPAGAFVGICAAAAANPHIGLFGLSIATFIAGGMILAMGLMRLGKSITFIPVPVVIGFTTGIAVTIASTQLAPLLGIQSHSFEHFTERVGHIWANRQLIAWQPISACVATVAIIIGLRRWKPLLPGAIIALVAVTLGCLGLGWTGGSGMLATIGDIPSAPPLPHLPGMYAGDGWSFGVFWQRLTGSGLDWQAICILAATVALLGSIESLLSAVVADGMCGDRHDSNGELIGQGIANLIVPFFGVLPATGVIARTSTNIRAGARSPVSGIVHAMVVLLILVACAPLVRHVPLACLAGVLLVVCWYMAELRHWPHIIRSRRSDAFLLPLATVLTIFAGLTLAVFSGVILAMFFFVKRMTDCTQIERHAADSGDDQERSAELPKGVEVYEVRGPFFFGAATLIRDIDGMVGEQPRALILRLRNVPFIDVTAAFSLRELHASCAKRGAELILSDCHTRPLADLDRHGLLELIGEDRVFGSYEGALEYAGEVSSAFSQLHLPAVAPPQA
jgi:sulfate permease, SulP family